MGNPVAGVGDAFAASNARPAAAGIGVPLLARFVKLGRLDAVDMDVVVAVTPPPRLKPVPVTPMVVGVPKVRPVSAGMKSKPSEEQTRSLRPRGERAQGEHAFYIPFETWVRTCRGFRRAEGQPGVRRRGHRVLLDLLRSRTSPESSGRTTAPEVRRHDANSDAVYNNGDFKPEGIDQSQLNAGGTCFIDFYSPRSVPLLI